MDRFDQCHAVTSKWEGGWSDHPDDPGGKTMWGVIQATYDAFRRSKGLPLRSVRLITKGEALEIYRKNYWEACGCDRLAPGVDLAVYDPAVNSGPGRSLAWLKKFQAQQLSSAELIRSICRARSSFLQGLKTWKVFGKGWARRVADIEVQALKMLSAATGASDNRFKEIAGSTAEHERTVAQQRTKTAKASGGASAGAGAIPAATTASHVDWTAIALLGGLAAIFLLVALYSIHHARLAKARAEAFEGAAA